MPCNFFFPFCQTSHPRKPSALRHGFIRDCLTRETTRGTRSDHPSSSHQPGQNTRETRPEHSGSSHQSGLLEYDPDGRKARALEDAIGIKVTRHGGKKPAGNADEIEKNFCCESSKLIMAGDRPFTDIVFGNRHGLFTILTEPLTRAQCSLNLY